MSDPSSHPSPPQLRVVNTVDVPRGGWRYTVECTGATVSAGSINSLKRDVFAHLMANRKEIPRDLEEQIEDAACRGLGASGAHWCEERVVPSGRTARSRWRLGEVLKFLKTIWAWGSSTQGGFRFVPMAEAERRAAICATCPMNLSVPGCLGCSGVAKLVKVIRGNHVTTHDAKLEVCDACGCELKVKVLVPAEVLAEGSAPAGVAYPSWCWQNPVDHGVDQEDEGQVEGNQ